MAAAKGEHVTAAVPEFRELLAGRLTDLLGGYSDDELPEAMWLLALGVIDRATARTKSWAWWKAYPRDELDRLRDQLGEALRLAEWAADLQWCRNTAEADESRLVSDLQSQAGQAARRRSPRAATG